MGKRGTHEFRVFKKDCLAAAISASRAAQIAGDSDDDDANNARAEHRASHEQSRHRVAPRSCGQPSGHASPPLYPCSECTAAGRSARLVGIQGDLTTDQDGTGRAIFTLNQGHGQICYDVAWSGVGTVSGLHIHLVADNSIVVPLDADADLSDGNAKGCVTGIAKNLIKAIRQHPEQYYVNVHTDEFAAGAIRGALSQ